MTATQSSCRHIAVVAATLVLLSCSKSPRPAAGAPMPATHTVTIDTIAFQPAALTIALGDTVVWVNKDLVPHTATSDTGGFDSQDIAPGASWKYTPTKQGDFAYVCLYHSEMTGTLHVR